MKLTTNLALKGGVKLKNLWGWGSGRSIFREWGVRGRRTPTIPAREGNE